MIPDRMKFGLGFLVCTTLVLVGFYSAVISTVVQPSRVRRDVQDAELKSILGDKPKKEVTTEDTSKAENKPSITVTGIDNEGNEVPVQRQSTTTTRNSTANSTTTTTESSTAAANTSTPEPTNSTESVEAAFLPEEGAAEKEHSSSLAIFFVLFVMILCIFLIHFLLQYKCHYIPESLGKQGHVQDATCLTITFRSDCFPGGSCRTLHEAATE